MNFKEGAPLVNGYPWGHGAKTVKHAPKHWKYACCGKTVKKNHDALHIYEDGDMTCSGCAEAWCVANVERVETPSKPTVDALMLEPQDPPSSDPVALNEQGELVLGFVA